MYKLSEQQINPKVLLVANSCHQMKMAKIVYRQMPAAWELPQQIPPRQKLGCRSPRVGANFWCKSSGVQGGMVMDEIDTFIILLQKTDSLLLLYTYQVG